MLELKPTTSPEGLHSNLSKQVFSNSKKYHQILPDHYIAAIQGCLGEEMQILGYQSDFENSEHRAFVERYLPIIAEAEAQVAEATKLKESRNWRPSMKTRLRALAKSTIRN